MTGKKRGSKGSLEVKPTEDGIKIVHRCNGGFIMDGFHNLWIDQSLCDVKLVSKGEEILAHKAVLAIFSDYFKAMFTSGLSESSEIFPSIQVDETEPETLKTLLKYMYTGTLSVTKDTVQDLIVLTDLLQMIEVKQQCCSFMEANLDITNCLDLWAFAEIYDCSSLVVKATTLIKKRFGVVIQTEEFLELPVLRLISILQFEDLCLGSEGEDEVMEAVIRWLEHSAADRLGSIREVLSLVKLNQISGSLMKGVLNMAVLSENRDLKDWIIEQRRSMVDRPPRHPIQFIYVVGGYLQSRTGPRCPRLRAIEKYDFRQNKWDTSVENLPILASGVHVFSIHGKFFCTSNIVNPDNCNLGNIESMACFFEYNNNQNVWFNTTNKSFTEAAFNTIHDSLKKNGTIAVCSKTNRIFAVSEKQVHVIKTTVEDGEVTFCEPIRLPDIEQSNVYSNYSALVYKEKLYVLGGDDIISSTEIFPTSAMFMYDDVSSSWVVKQSMQEPRAMFCTAVVGDHIYAIGGFNNRRLRSVERYNPLTNTWTYVESMNKERSHCECVVYQDKIYVMGGKSYSRFEGGARKVLNSCEVYDPETDLWTFIAPMKQARCLFGAGLF